MIANTPMFDPATDRLGVGVKSRAALNRFTNAAQGLSSPIGPLPDPNWDGYFEAVNESAGGRRVRYGMADQPESDASRDNIVNPNMWMVPQSASQQLGTPYDSKKMLSSLPPSMAALFGAR